MATIATSQQQKQSAASRTASSTADVFTRCNLPEQLIRRFTATQDSKNNTTTNHVTSTKQQVTKTQAGNTNNRTNNNSSNNKRHSAPHSNVTVSNQQQQHLKNNSKANLEKLLLSVPLDSDVANFSDTEGPVRSRLPLYSENYETESFCLPSSGYKSDTDGRGRSKYKIRTSHSANPTPDQSPERPSIRASVRRTRSLIVSSDNDHRINDIRQRLQDVKRQETNNTASLSLSSTTALNSKSNNIRERLAQLDLRGLNTKNNPTSSKERSVYDRRAGGQRGTLRSRSLNQIPATEKSQSRLATTTTVKENKTEQTQPEKTNSDDKSLLSAKSNTSVRRSRSFNSTLNNRKTRDKAPEQHESHSKRTIQDTNSAKSVNSTLRPSPNSAFDKVRQNFDKFNKQQPSGKNNENLRSSSFSTLQNAWETRRAFQKDTNTQNTTSSQNNQRQQQQSQHIDSDRHHNTLHYTNSISDVESTDIVSKRRERRRLKREIYNQRLFSDKSDSETETEDTHFARHALERLERRRSNSNPRKTPTKTRQRFDLPDDNLSDSNDENNNCPSDKTLDSGVFDLALSNLSANICQLSKRYNSEEFLADCLSPKSGYSSATESLAESLAESTTTFYDSHDENDVMDRGGRKRGVAVKPKGFRPTTTRNSDKNVSNKTAVLNSTRAHKTNNTLMTSASTSSLSTKPGDSNMSHQPNASSKKSTSKIQAAASSATNSSQTVKENTPPLSSTANKAVTSSSEKSEKSSSQAITKPQKGITTKNSNNKLKQNTLEEPLDNHQNQPINKSQGNPKTSESQTQLSAPTKAIKGDTATTTKSSVNKLREATMTENGHKDKCIDPKPKKVNNDSTKNSTNTTSTEQIDNVGGENLLSRRKSTPTNSNTKKDKLAKTNSTNTNHTKSDTTRKTTPSSPLSSSVNKPHTSENVSRNSSSVSPSPNNKTKNTTSGSASRSGSLKEKKSPIKQQVENTTTSSPTPPSSSSTKKKSAPPAVSPKKKTTSNNKDQLSPSSPSSNKLDENQSSKLLTTTAAAELDEEVPTTHSNSASNNKPTSKNSNETTSISSRSESPSQVATTASPSKSTTKSTGSPKRTPSNKSKKEECATTDSGGESSDSSTTTIEPSTPPKTLKLGGLTQRKISHHSCCGSHSPTIGDGYRSESPSSSVKKTRRISHHNCLTSSSTSSLSGSNNNDSRSSTPTKTRRVSHAGCFSPSHQVDIKSPTDTSRSNTPTRRLSAHHNCFKPVNNNSSNPNSDSESNSRCNTPTPFIPSPLSHTTQPIIPPSQRPTRERRISHHSCVESPTRQLESPSRRHSLQHSNINNSNSDSDSKDMSGNFRIQVSNNASIYVGPAQRVDEVQPRLARECASPSLNSSPLATATTATKNDRYQINELSSIKENGVVINNSNNSIALSGAINKKDNGIHSIDNGITSSTTGASRRGNTKSQQHNSRNRIINNHHQQHQNNDNSNNDEEKRNSTQTMDKKETSGKRNNKIGTSSDHYNTNHTFLVHEDSTIQTNTYNNNNNKKEHLIRQGEPIAVHLSLDNNNKITAPSALESTITSKSSTTFETKKVPSVAPKPTKKHVSTNTDVKNSTTNEKSLHKSVQCLLLTSDSKNTSQKEQQQPRRQSPSTKATEKILDVNEFNQQFSLNQHVVDEFGEEVLESIRLTYPEYLFTAEEQKQNLLNNLKQVEELEEEFSSPSEEEGDLDIDQTDSSKPSTTPPNNKRLQKEKERSLNLKMENTRLHELLCEVEKARIGTMKALMHVNTALCKVQGENTELESELKVTGHENKQLKSDVRAYVDKEIQNIDTTATSTKKADRSLSIFVEQWKKEKKELLGQLRTMKTQKEDGEKANTKLQAQYSKVKEQLAHSNDAFTKTLENNFETTRRMEEEMKRSMEEKQDMLKKMSEGNKFKRELERLKAELDELKAQNEEVCQGFFNSFCFVLFWFGLLCLVLLCFICF